MPTFTSAEARRWISTHPDAECIESTCDRSGMRSVMGFLMHMEQAHGYTVRRNTDIETPAEEEPVSDRFGTAEAREANGKSAAAVELGRRGGRKGGLARAAALSPEERSSIARKAADARWSDRSSQASDTDQTGEKIQDLRDEALAVHEKAEGEGHWHDDPQDHGDGAWSHAHPINPPTSAEPVSAEPPTPPGSWERFDKNMRLGMNPTVAIYSTGTLNMNHAAYLAIGEPLAIEVLFDRQRKMIGLKPADHHEPWTYLVHHIGKNKLSHSLSVKAFLIALGLGEQVSCHRYDAILEDGVLCIQPDGGTW